MKIRAKVLLTALVSLTVALTSTTIIVRTLLIDYFQNEEVNIVVQDYHRAVLILRNEQNSLENTQMDWAKWDDAYWFMYGRDAQFVDANLQEETLESLELNYMIFADKNYRAVSSIVKDLEADSEDAFIERLLNLIRENQFFTEPSESMAVTGITIHGGKPMFISLSPVTTTDGTAPGNGFLIIGKYVSQSFISYMEELLMVKINIAIPQTQVHVADSRFDLIKTAADGESIKIEKNRSSIKSYVEMDDILNDESVLIEFILDRNPYLNGMETINFFGLIYLLLLLVVAGICIYVFDRLVTHRINKLHAFVAKVTASKDTTSRISVGGKDEISKLAFNMNNMLGELDNSYTELKKNEERFRRIMEATNDGYFDADLKTNEIYISQSWLNYLGYPRHNGIVEYEEYLQLVFPEDRKTIEFVMDKLLLKGETDIKAEYRVMKSTGELIWNDIRGRAVEFDEKGVPFRIIGTISDITKRKKYEKDNLYLMETDPITTLKNRAHMEIMLKDKNKCKECNGWIIMGDVNGLKLVNDSYGHQEGDKLLRTIGEVLVRRCSEGDIPARWGGDEFLILVSNPDAAYVESLIHRIKTECEKTADYPFKINMAMGSASKDEKHSELNDVLKLAEERMYRNKLLESRSARSAIIFSLEQSLHEKHIETEMHTRRMHQICEQIGGSLGLTQEELDELALLAVLHDIGKMAIPETILLKPGKLTDDEWEVMKTHTEIGYRIAASTPELVHIANEILCHHERYDGKGYPQGLAGRDIPKLSRLLSIVDSYDVMTHDRVYRKAMNLEDAALELKNCSGTQFDPEMIEAFLKMLEEHLFDS